MLQSLHIVNFAIIEDTVIDLTKGVTIFTGETGAGKSILIDALAVLTRTAGEDGSHPYPALISSKWKGSSMRMTASSLLYRS